MPAFLLNALQAEGILHPQKNAAGNSLKNTKRSRQIPLSAPCFTGDYSSIFSTISLSAFFLTLSMPFMQPDLLV